MPMVLCAPQALLRQVEGAMGASGGVLSSGHVQQFAQNLRAVLGMLKRVSHMWDMEDPCVICGFDMDRDRAIQV